MPVCSHRLKFRNSLSFKLFVKNVNCSGEMHTHIKLINKINNQTFVICCKYVLRIRARISVKRSTDNDPDNGHDTRFHINMNC